MEPYRLRGELRAHEADMRAAAVSDNAKYIATASRDKTVTVWEAVDGGADGSGGEAGGYKLRGTLKGHTRFVTTVDFVTLFGRLRVVSGSTDRSLRVWDVERMVEVGLGRGHWDAVCEVRGWGTQILSSGWDGTGRIWRVEEDKGEDGEEMIGVKCLRVMEGHKGAVWSLLPMKEGGFMSAGEDRAVRLWDGQGRPKAVLQFHRRAVRGVAETLRDGLVSVGHDANEVYWMRSFSGFSVDRLCEKLHDARFIYKCVTWDDGRRLLVISAGEDGTVRIVHAKIYQGDYKCIQTLPHPGTVWDVRMLPNGDILTACSDGVARLFTRDQSRAADSETIAAYEKSVSVRKVCTKLTEGLDLDALPEADTSLSEPGKKDGESKIVKGGSGPEVHRWLSTDAKWLKVADVVPNPVAGTGTVTGPGKVQGKIYDYVLEVVVGYQRDVAHNLGYNAGESPYVAAQRFIDDNELPQHYLDQLAIYTEAQVGPDAIRATSSGFSDPFMSGSRYLPRRGGISRG